MPIDKGPKLSWVTWTHRGEKTVMPEPKWSLRGEYMESCNCDYLCLRIYTNPQEAVTHDHCTAARVFRIDEDDFGGTELRGA
jgi:hypothetical protein